MRRRLLLSALLIAACDTRATTPIGVDLSFLVVSGDGQSGIVGRPLSSPLVVQATDSRGRPQKNLQVNFVVTSGGGSATPASAKTDQNGLAQTSWTLGTSVTQAQRLEARAGSTLLGAFTASPLPGPAAQLAVQAGNSQSAVYSTPVAVAPAVLVQDQYLNPVPGAAVTFTVTTGGGSVTGSPATSGSSGVATVGSWTLGSTVGANTLRAAVSGANPITFTASATPGPAARMTLHAGDDQTAEANTNVAIRPAVRITDAAGNAVGGIRVTFVPVVGGNYVYPDTASSAADGVAAPSFWMLGTKTGPNTMRATAPGIADTVTFHATAVSGPVDADHSGIAAVPDKITTSSTSRIYVIARSNINNPVPGATVVFEATGAGNAIVQPSGPTDSSGYAEGQFSSTMLGQKVVSATINGIRITPTWTVTVEGGPPAHLSLHAGNNQTAQVNTNLAVPPAVLIRDANGNPVPRASAVFVFTQGSGVINNAIPQSGEDGVAAVNYVTLGTIAGPFVIRATVQGLADTVFFTGVGAAGPPATMAARAGANQTGSMNTAVAIAPSIIVQDSFNNGVPGVEVTFAVTSGGGRVAGPNPVTTSSDGVATIGSWTLGPLPGTNTLTATADGAGISGNPATFTAQAIGDVWTSAAPLSAPRGWLAAATIDGKVYAVGGSGLNVGRRLEAYDPTTNSWTTKAPMPTHRSNPGVGVVDGILYVVGGWSGGVSGAVEAYDPVTNTWIAKAPLPTPRYMMAVGVANGVLYAIGGYSGTLVCEPDCGWVLTLSATVEAYDPATDSWSTRASLPTPRRGHAVAELNGIIYAVGGSADNDSWLATVDAYDPAIDTWTARGSMPTGRFALGAGAVGGRLYALGGEVAPNTIIRTVEAYDPATNTWTTKAPLPTTRESFGTAVSQGLLYVVGGMSYFDQPWKFGVFQVEYVDVYHP